MPVRKKKQLHANRQKTELAQHQKQFISEVKDIIAKAAGAHIVRFIPEYELEHLYSIRFHPVRVKAAQGETIPKDMLEFCNHLVTLLFKTWQIPVEVGTLTALSLYQFFSTGYTVITYAQRITDDDYPHASTVKKALEPLAAVFSSSTNELALEKYGKIMRLLELWCSNFNEYLYTFKFCDSLIARGINKAGLYSDIYKTRLPKIKILVGEHERPAWHLGWHFAYPEPHLMLASVQSEDIFQAPGNKLDVYIQSHALNRLAERLDGIERGILHYNVFNSLYPPKVCRTKTGMLLFEYAIFGDKAGYFVGEPIDGKIILKTFLFLTHKGTPEADKLQAITGLMREDINYLDIDKLSTFTFSDIASNERLKQLFIKAGCESLFKIEKDLFISFSDIPAIAKAASIEKYLQLTDIPKHTRY